MGFEWMVGIETKLGKVISVREDDCLVEHGDDETRILISEVLQIHVETLELMAKDASEWAESVDPIYCPTCGHCGEEGCCGALPHPKCADAKPNHCLYGKPTESADHANQ